MLPVSCAFVNLIRCTQHNSEQQKALSMEISQVGEVYNTNARGIYLNGTPMQWFKNLLGLNTRRHVLCTFLVPCGNKNIPIWQLFWSHLDLLQIPLMRGVPVVGNLCRNGPAIYIDGSRAIYRISLSFRGPK